MRCVFVNVRGHPFNPKLLFPVFAPGLIQGGVLRLKHIMFHNVQKAVRSWLTVCCTKQTPAMKSKPWNYDWQQITLEYEVSRNKVGKSTIREVDCEMNTNNYFTDRIISILVGMTWLLSQLHLLFRPLYSDNFSSMPPKVSRTWGIQIYMQK